MSALLIGNFIQEWSYIQEADEVFSGPSNS